LSQRPDIFGPVTAVRAARGTGPAGALTQVFVARSGAAVSEQRPPIHGATEIFDPVHTWRCSSALGAFAAGRLPIFRGEVVIRRCSPVPPFLPPKMTIFDG
jgi:hypothetical protein